MPTIANGITNTTMMTNMIIAMISLTMRSPVRT